MEPLSDEGYETARATLAKAIQTYYDTVSGEYVEAWILVTHKRSVEMEAEGTSAVGVLTAKDQSWVLSRGMIDIASESDAFSGYPSNDDDDD